MTQEEMEAALTTLQSNLTETQQALQTAKVELTEAKANGATTAQLAEINADRDGLANTLKALHERSNALSAKLEAMEARQQQNPVPASPSAPEPPRAPEPAPHDPPAQRRTRSGQVFL